VRALAGNPAQVLLEQAADADLLVVGHRGLGSIAGTWLGSVGLQCVLHATCPVAVVRPSAVRGAAVAPPKVGATASTA
jgi:nucleotide-binding universal stress UspA family protein